MADTGSCRGRPSDDVDRDRLIEELQEAVRARDEFVTIAAHELRNPMTPILMQVTSLAAAARNPSRTCPDLMARRLDILEAAVRDFVRRSTALLDVSRVAAGNLRMEPAAVDLTEVVRTGVERAGIAARMARTSLEADLQDGVVGIWDRLALEQVTENLLSNAVKFGAGKPVRVHLRSDGSAAQLTVSDRGIGLSDADRARIFGRFEQAVGRREHGGFGVGLWLTQRLVTAMNGAIMVESAPGKGATFTVTLPQGGLEQQMMDGA
ncbi:sensor histidine kinase [Pseudoroseomonas globiformis]|uniref:histidine kinase n=1 Tax=Teichococcus globiformis TaxID=2307229 RepID=A0ABV7FVH8_9PROT